MQYPLSQIIYFPLIDKHYVMWCVFFVQWSSSHIHLNKEKNHREEIAKTVIGIFLNSSSDNRTCCVKLINRKNTHIDRSTWHVLIIKKRRIFASIIWTSAASIFSKNKQIYIHHNRDSDVIFLKLSTTADRSYYYCVWYDPLD